MKTRTGRSAVVAIMFALAACTSGPETTGATAPSPVTATTDLTPTILDILAGEAEPFGDLQPGTYSLDPDLDPATPLRVVYDVSTEGWQSWIGAAKFSDAGWLSLSITTVSNLVSHGCHDHSWADPPVGPSVADLATSLADLAPFHVTSPPEDVSVYGYRGTHLELTVPKDQPFSDDGNFVGCAERKLKSWVAAIDAGEEGDAFYGYTDPGYHEEFWILDVEGTRLMIAAGRSPGSPPGDLAELRAILDTIRIEP
jgi:hypothetical protein